MGKRGGERRLEHAPQEEEYAGSYVLRVLKAGSLGVDLNRIFIIFMLMQQNEIYFLNFILPWV